MNTTHASTFLLIGLGMLGASLLGPEWFPATGIDGSNGRMLWLMLMGAVQACIGGTYLGWRSIAVAALLLENVRVLLEPSEVPVGEIEVSLWGFDLKTATDGRA